MGNNLQLEFRWGAGDGDRLQNYAVELAGLKPDAILAASTPTVAALKQATQTIPIVFSNVSNPIAGGFVESLARPGSNITGFTSFAPSMGEKWVETLKDLAPGVERIALVSQQPQGGDFVRSIEAASEKLRVEPVRLAYREARKLEPALERFARGSNCGMLVLPENANVSNRDVIVSLAAHLRLPAIYPLRIYMTNGALAYYGNDRTEQWRRAAEYIERILKGAKPGDLLVQAPTKFELVINLRTAKALGLTISPMLLARADEVLE